MILTFEKLERLTALKSAVHSHGKIYCYKHQDIYIYMDR